MPTILDNLAAVRSAITDTAMQFGRDPADIRLLAVSKTFPVEAIREAISGGQREFGENYLQEALVKIKALRDEELAWHFIGRIQSNKTRDIAEHFDWVHTVDRDRVARRLNEQRESERAPLNVCLQVNLDDEAQKSGVSPANLPALAQSVAQLPRLRLRGLMAIPAPRTSFEEQRDVFARLRRLGESLRADGIQLDTLSIGMSGDMTAAIAEGSTLVRIGTAIFGSRG